MTETHTIIEPTTAIRDWLRTKPTITAAVGVDSTDRVAVYAGGLPGAPTYPAVVVTRVGGGLNPPLDLGLYQFDCWAATATAAANLAGVLCSLLESTGPTTLDTITIAGANVNTAAADPDLDNPNTHRYIVTAQVVTKHHPT